MQRFDKYWIGFVFGLVVPALFCLVYIDRMNLWYALQTLQFGVGSVLYKLLYVSVFPDLAFLFVFYTLDLFKVAKGTLAGALPYILASIALSI